MKPNHNTKNTDAPLSEHAAAKIGESAMIKINQFWTEIKKMFLEEWETLESILWFLMGILAAIFLLSLFNETVAKKSMEWIGANNKIETLKFIGVGIGGILAAIGAIAINRRADAQVESAKAQVETNQLMEKGHINERFKTAAEHLGKPETQITAYYEFCQLAKNHKKSRKIVFNILCAHLRKETSTAEYKEIAKERPAENIQSLLDILFKPEFEFKDIFEEFDADLPRTHLLSANLKNVCMKNARFTKANLQNAYFYKSYLQNARFINTNLQNTDFWDTNLQNADFTLAKLQDAHFRNHTNLQNAILYGANLQGAIFWDTNLQNADFTLAKLQDADFRDTNLQGANLSSARNMTSEMIQCAIIDEYTKLPAGISHPSRK